MLEHVIFSVDNVTDLNAYKKAIHQLDVASAMKDIAGVTMCLGSYKGQMEPSFMVRAMDWPTIRERLRGYLEDQESVLRVPGDVRQPCTLETVDGEHIVGLGPMMEIDNPLEHEGWTYVIETGKYFTC